MGHFLLCSTCSSVVLYNIKHDNNGNNNSNCFFHCVQLRDQFAGSEWGEDIAPNIKRKDAHISIY